MRSGLDGRSAVVLDELTFDPVDRTNQSAQADCWPDRSARLALDRPEPMRSLRMPTGPDLTAEIGDGGNAVRPSE